MIEKFLRQTKFESQEDFNQNYHLTIPENFNFAIDVVDEWAKKEPNKKALCWCNDQGDHIQFTFEQIKKESDQTAAMLQRLGIQAGDKVMLILKRRYEFWFSILALHKLGAVAIPATHLLTSKDIIYRANAADIKMIISVGEPEVIKHIQDALPSCPSVEKIVSIDAGCPEGIYNFQEEKKNSPIVSFDQYPCAKEEISLLYFTSGTTGNPKMVAHDFTYPLGHIITGKYWHNLTEDSLHLTLADTGWGKAVWGKLYGQWIVGANVFVYDFDKFAPLDILKMIEQYKITSFCAPPTVFRFLIRENTAQYDISSLKYCTIAGEALNPTVFNEWEKLTGIKLMEGFGQTETTLIIGSYPWIEPKPGSMGIANPHYKINLLTPDGNWAEDGETGEIVIELGDQKIAGLFKEYYRDEQKTQEVMCDGLYHTGDIAWRDEDGYFWFVGRADDVIKSSGYRIGPFEVESALMTHPSVVECAITGEPDEIRGQVIKATIVLAQEYKEQANDALVKTLQEHVKKVTAPYKYPRIIEFVDQLPKTISGKIQRFAIRNKK